MSKPKREYLVQGISNALQLLECFGEREEFGLTELAARVGLGKNTAFRALATLVVHGYLEQDGENGPYRIGPAALELAHRLGRGQALLRHARRILEELAGSLGETAHLAVLRDFEVVHLDGQVADRPVVAGLRLGQRAPAHCTALGKVLLAHTAPEVREAFDREVIAARLPAFTRATITDRSKFLEELRAIPHRGFALDLEEWNQGLTCVAAPVLDRSGEVVAALSISGPSFRNDAPDLLVHHAPELVRAAGRLSAGLGAPSPT